jgi:hypothetical protein
VKASDFPFESRALPWNANHSPIPADVITYALVEWENLRQKKTPRPAKQQQKSAGCLNARKERAS